MVAVEADEDVQDEHHEAAAEEPDQVRHRIHERLHNVVHLLKNRGIFLAQASQANIGFWGA